MARTDPRYDSASWRAVRKTVRRRDRDLCRWPDGSSECGKAATGVDHRIAVEDGGDFFDPDNLWSLCNYHHYSVKTWEDRRARSHRLSECWYCSHGYVLDAVSGTHVLGAGSPRARRARKG